LHWFDLAQYRTRRLLRRSFPPSVRWPVICEVGAGYQHQGGPVRVFGDLCEVGHSCPL
jgi:hypothetical protein